MKTIRQIVSSIFAAISSATNLNDDTEGSVLLSIVEAVSLEISAVYNYLLSVKKSFFIRTASRADLDERLFEFGIARKQAANSQGYVVVSDPGVTTANTTLGASASIGATTITLTSYASFPASGVVILDRGNSSRETIAYTSKTAPNVLNISALARAHSSGATVHLSTVGVDRTIPENTTVKVTFPEKLFLTTEAGTILDGNSSSGSILAVSVGVGEDQNITEGSIDGFVSEPFTGAAVTNAASFYFGADEETDEELVDRALLEIQSRTVGTRGYIEMIAKTVTLGSERVQSAKVIEEGLGVSSCYISNGDPAFSATTESVVNEVITFRSPPDRIYVKTAYWPIEDTSISLLGPIDTGTGIASGVTLTDSSKSWTINEYANFFVVDADGNLFEIQSNTATALTLDTGAAPVSGVFCVISTAGYTDYTLNASNGEIVLDTPLNQNEALLATYDYYDGLVRETQRKLNGDPNDIENYPGSIAAGSRCDVFVCTVVTTAVTASLTVKPGFDELTLIPLVKASIENYLNTLPIGEAALIAQLYRVATSVSGALNITFSLPTTDVVPTDTQVIKAGTVSIT